MEVAILANMVTGESWTEIQGSMGTSHSHILTSGLPDKDNFKYKSPSFCGTCSFMFQKQPGHQSTKVEQCVQDSKRDTDE